MESAVMDLMWFGFSHEKEHKVNIELLINSIRNIVKMAVQMTAGQRKDDKHSDKFDYFNTELMSVLIESCRLAKTQELEKIGDLTSTEEYSRYFDKKNSKFLTNIKPTSDIKHFKEAAERLMENVSDINDWDKLLAITIPILVEAVYLDASGVLEELKKNRMGE